MKRFLLALVPYLLAAQAPHPAAPDPRELMRLSADAVRKYHTYQIRSITLIDMQGGPFDNHVEMPTTVSVRRPDRMRIESESQTNGITMVSDGEFTWIYLEPQNAYIKRAAVSSPDAAVSQAAVLRNLPDISKSIQTVRLTGQETIEVEGVPYPCWTVETRFTPIAMPSFASGGTIQGAVQTSWIDKQRHLLLKNTFRAKVISTSLTEPVTMNIATHTAMLKLDPDLADSLFTFTPPEDSKERDDWTLPGIQRPDVIGKPVAGLAAHRGRVVLLDFETAWSGPARREHAVIEKVGRELREQGLETIVIDTEDAALVKALAISSFPTIVLIDRAGKVASYEAGARGEALLRADLAKLGITSK